MRSSLKMVLAEPERLPAIKVKVVKNDEDELVGQVFQIFNEEFQHESEWCSVVWGYVNEGRPDEEKHLLIKPISPLELQNQHDRIGRKLMEMGKIPIPEKAKYIQEDMNFVYSMFPSGRINISSNSPSIKAFDAANTLLDVIVNICNMLKKVDVSEEDRIKLDKKMDRVIHDLPIYLGKKDPYQDLIAIPYIDGKMTALQWFKSIPNISYDWVWCVENDKVKVNNIPVTSKDLSTKMMDISTNDPALFDLSGAKDIILEVDKRKYLLTFSINGLRKSK